jgi:uncharacterized membrane protein
MDRMLYNVLLIVGLAVFGIFTLAKGELKITNNKKVKDTTARILGGVLLLGAGLGFVNPIISFVILILVVITAYFLLEDIDPEVDTSEYGGNPGVYINNPEMAFASAESSFPGGGMPSLRNVNQPAPLPVPHVYSEYIVYNMRSSFKKKPGQPRQCTKCGELLKATPLPPSLSVRSDLSSRELKTNHRYTYLFTCEKCHWWCFRENWKSGSINNYIFDYLVVGAIHGSAMSSNLYSSPIPSDQPWMAALQEPNLYGESENLPADLKRIFPAI